MHKSTTYRLSIARFLLIWMCGIIVSGVVFMHKEVTSTGEIVTHIHPYNLGEKKHHQHHSDAEIRYLDIIYQGSYVEWSPFVYSAPIQTLLSEVQFGFAESQQITRSAHSHADRGPPALLV